MFSIRFQYKDGHSFETVDDVRMLTLGYSVDGRLMYVLHFNDNPDENMFLDYAEFEICDIWSAN